MKPILGSLIAVSTVSLLVACREQQHAAAPAPRPVLSIIVAAQNVRSVSFAGTVEPRYKSDLGFRVLGRIVSRDVSIGDVVTEDERLATLDSVAYQLAVRSAQSDLDSATARLENATATEARQRTLLDQNIANQAQFDAARQARDTAKAGVARANAELDKAEEQLGYTELRADFGGVVIGTEAELGQVVQPGQTVITIARTDTREAVVDLPESIGQGLQPGARFDIALQLDPSLRTLGSVREVAPQADPATRTRRVRIMLDSPPGSFRLGTTITATVSTEGSSTIDLPASALVERNGRMMVWVVDPTARTVSTREVTIAARDEASVQVLDGLSPGIRVVTAGVNSLTPNQSIKITDEALP
jgi:membrane fusion protein, multidrug efflux system